MNMRVLRVAMNSGNPFKGCAEVLFHSPKEFPSMPLEIQTVAKLGRQNDLEQTLIAGCLPTVESHRDIQISLDCIESSFGRSFALSRTISRHIFPVRLPLAGILICGIADAHCHTLVEGARALPAMMCSLDFSPPL